MAISAFCFIKKVKVIEKLNPYMNANIINPTKLNSQANLEADFEFVDPIEIKVRS